MARPSNAYWDQRAQQRMSRYHRGSNRVMGQISKAYDKGQSNIEASIDRILGKFAREGGLTVEEATRLLNEPISRSEWIVIKEQYKKVRDPVIRRQLLARLNAPAYAARITRQQALQADMFVQSKLIADAELAISTQGYMGTINEAYYRTIFDLQRGVGVGFNFARMPNKVIQTILKRPWSGQHYSKRIWGNTSVLAKTLAEVVTGGLKSGTSLRDMRREIEERLEVGKHAANRLLRTETTYMANAAEMEAYEEAEIERYQFVATLDNRTSEQCRKQDLKVYRVKEARPGVNMPPLHPYCRSTTIAVLDLEEESNLMRRARDPESGKSALVPAYLSYEDWEKKNVSNSAGNRSTIVSKEYRKFTSANEASEWINVVSAAWLTELTPAESSAITLYTGSSYKAINRHLRGISANPSLDPTIENISNGLKKFTLEENLTVYRGWDDDLFGLPVEQLKGLVYSDDAFYSTSLLPEKAKDFSKNFFAEIRVPAGFAGATVRPISNFPHEYEFLLDKGTTFRILEAVKEGHGVKLLLEVVTDG